MPHALEVVLIDRVPNPAARASHPTWSTPGRPCSQLVRAALERRLTPRRSRALAVASTEGAAAVGVLTEQSYRCLTLWSDPVLPQSAGPAPSVTVTVWRVPDASVHAMETRSPGSWLASAVVRSATLATAVPPTAVIVEPAVIPAFSAPDPLMTPPT